MNINRLKSLTDFISTSSVTEFQMETAGFKIRINQNSASNLRQPRSHQAYTPQLSAAPAPQALLPSQSTPKSLPEPKELEIKSQWIGIFKTKPSPNAHPFVKVGTEVNANTTVALIESMRIDNPIKAEISGTITEILVKNDQPVEYGQPLYKIRPN